MLYITDHYASYIRVLVLGVRCGDALELNWVMGQGFMFIDIYIYCTYTIMFHMTRLSRKVIIKPQLCTVTFALYERFR